MTDTTEQNETARTLSIIPIDPACTEDNPVHLDRLVMTNSDDTTSEHRIKAATLKWAYVTPPVEPSKTCVDVKVKKRCKPKPAVTFINKLKRFSLQYADNFGNTFVKTHLPPREWTALREKMVERAKYGHGDIDVFTVPTAIQSQPLVMQAIVKALRTQVREHLEGVTVRQRDDGTFALEWCD